MRRTTLALALFSLASAPLVAQAKPDFSGTWKLNPDKSDMGQGAQNRPGGGAAMQLFITQMADKLVIEQKMGERSRMVTYLLNGQESSNAGMRGTEVKTKSHWEGNTLITEGDNTMSTPGGDMQVKTREERSLSADGKTLTVVTTMSSDRGTRNRKLVYEKQ
jgi:hypothetical protein